MHVALPLLTALSLLAPPPPTRSPSGIAQDTGRAVLYLFWGNGCPHCAAEKRFLADLQQRQPGLVVREFEVWYDSANQALFQQMAAAYGFEARGVPTTFLGSRHWVGFNEGTGREIDALAAICASYGCPDAGARVPGLRPRPGPAISDAPRPAPAPPESAAPTMAPRAAAPAIPLPASARAAASQRAAPTPAARDTTATSPSLPPATPAATAAPPATAAPDTAPAAGRTLHVPLLGDVDLARHSLVVSTALIAFVDGVNPCSIWVLSVLLALTLQTGSRRRVLLIGVVFLTVTSLVYVAFIAGLFTVFRVVRFVGWFQVLVAVIALGFGLINVKDYFWWGVGPSLTIAAEDKPGIYRAMRRVRAAGESLWGTVAATVALSAGVSLVEFGCTAGFPVLWTNLLIQQQATPLAFAVLLLLYMVIYQLDELALFLTAVFTLRASRFEERHGRVLKLLGGTLMLALAGVMLVRPALLQEVGSALLVFGAAFLSTLLVLAVHRGIRRRRATPT